MCVSNLLTLSNQTAYLLGLILANYDPSTSTVSVSLCGNDGKQILHKLSDEYALGRVTNNCVSTFWKGEPVTYTVNIPCDLFDISTLNLSDALSKSQLASLLLGLLDASAPFRSDTLYSSTTISVVSPDICNKIKQILPNIPSNTSDTTITYSGPSALDFLAYVYSNKPKLYLEYNYQAYLHMAAWLAADTHKNNLFMGIKCAKLLPEAVLPTKAHGSDSGYDITAIDIYKKIGDVTLYNTGLSMQPPDGWWLALVPRSSISKTGYMLANSIGIIDQTYTGPILIALRKVDSTAPDLELPCKIAQIVPMPVTSFEILEVSSLAQTERNSGGFGSSDNK